MLLTLKSSLVYFVTNENMRGWAISQGFGKRSVRKRNNLNLSWGLGNDKFKNAKLKKPTEQ